MAYTCSLLLRTLPAIDDEVDSSAPDTATQILLNLPRPKRDWPEGTDPEIAKHENWDSYIASQKSKARRGTRV